MTMSINAYIHDIANFQFRNVRTGDRKGLIFTSDEDEYVFEECAVEDRDGG